MNSSTNNSSDPNSLIPWHTCEELDNVFLQLYASFNGTANITGDKYLAKFRSPHCIPTVYPGIQGHRKWILSGCLILFLLFGFVGNLLSATIMFRRARRGLSSYFYLALLALVDICILYTGGLVFLLEAAFNYQPQLISNHFCRFEFYIQHLFTYTSAWLIVAVTFERFIVVRYPFQSIRICRLHVAYTITFLIVFFFSIYTAHAFFTIEIMHHPMHTVYGYHPDYLICELKTHRSLLGFLDLCFYSILPSIFILIFNILIIYTMFYAMKQRQTYLQASSGLRTTETFQRQQLNPKNNKSSTSGRTPFFRSRSIESTPPGRSIIPQSVRYPPTQVAVRRFSQRKSQQVLYDSTSSTGIRLTILLLIISFVFVTCTLPTSIRIFIREKGPEYNSTERWQFVQLLVTLLMYFNHTINFILYCLTGRAFRHECRKLLCGLWTIKDFHLSCTCNPHGHKHHHRQYHLTTTNRMRMTAQRRMI